MIVTQADYQRWQQMYSKDAQEDSLLSAGQETGNGAAFSQVNADVQGQSVAASSAGEQTGNRTEDEHGHSQSGEHCEHCADHDHSNSQSSKDSEESFITTAYEKLLANRLGLDQEKLEELKEEIEQTEQAIEGLKKQEPLTEAQQTTLSALKDKLKKLTEELEELIRQSSERASEHEASENATQQSVENTTANNPTIFAHELLNFLNKLHNKTEKVST
ncbi:hypothetical protein [Alteromonas sp. a30]|uniref:hypothetical protein n=1 Tax=Alteromonas sp. a30 TaxID=2730917 RepID=UPI00227ECA45|nr:hypothetical protein [Alteromonas sp. a30]MCY7294610.1 hypothetical protein [Alteromonas sp. a30]